MSNELEDRLRIMREMDIEAVKAFLIDAETQPDAEVFEIMLHKSRYESVLLERNLRLESYWFLKTRGLKRIGGAPLLPNGELPE